MVDVVDIRSEVDAVTEANPAPAAGVKRFLRRRSFDRRLLEWVARHFGLFAKAASSPIALGTMFLPHILGFKAHTTIYWYIVAPRRLGGTSPTLIYLTATNQAAAGPEALVKYNGSVADAMFSVFDPKKGGFVVNIPYTDPIYRRHRITLSIDGGSHEALYVANMTSGGGQSWKNEVFLYDPQAAKFSLVWHFAFAWDPTLSICRQWGPIIEVDDEDRFGQTNPLGYSDARLISDQGDYRLVPGEARFEKNEDYEFEDRHLVHNYEMLAD